MHLEPGIDGASQRQVGSVGAGSRVSWNRCGGSFVVCLAARGCWVVGARWVCVLCASLLCCRLQGTEDG